MQLKPSSLSRVVTGFSSARKSGTRPNPRLSTIGVTALSMRSKNCVHANCMNGIIAEDVEFNINVNYNFCENRNILNEFPQNL